MKVTVTMELTAANLDKLKLLLDEGAELEAEKTVPKTPEKEAPATGVKPELETPEAPAPEPDHAITKTDIRAVALKLSKAGKQKELAEIFAKFGAKKLSDFDARPGDYPALMKALVSIDA